MPLAKQIKILQYMIAAGIVARRTHNRFVGEWVRTRVRTREYRLVIVITREADNKTIQSIDWDRQSRPTGEDPNRLPPRRGAIHA